MVSVLMGQHNPVDAVGVNTERLKALVEFSQRKPAVDENPRGTGLDQSRVTATPTAKGGKSHSADLIFEQPQDLFRRRRGV